ncbi:hypothetical protein KR093_009390 [Drosophila rubida]|uniref:Uncharacterized protein n=1 Tax=Drosophila rubida TaxID=30044 RepID=A0AAD4JSU0_9MUSC|nr:hypothetical protein KR093_009390 [Drosophila rubida]
MSVNVWRDWSAICRLGLARQGRCCLRQHQRHFILPPKQEETNMRVVNSAYAPQLVYKYNPLKYYLSKLRMLKLKWTWDRNFKEHDFLEESKRTAISLTDILRLRDIKQIDQFSTSNVYYQMANESINLPESCAELLRFRKQDIRQVVPINVHLHKILGLKYAIIDVVMVGLRHVADCETDEDLAKMKSALIQMEPELKVQIDDASTQLPYIFIELFMRFRRNYSNAEQISGVELASHTNRWLVSVYKICRFNIFTVPPTT